MNQDDDMDVEETGFHEGQPTESTPVSNNAPAQQEESKSENILIPINNSAPQQLISPEMLQNIINQQKNSVTFSQPPVTTTGFQLPPTSEPLTGIAAVRKEFESWKQFNDYIKLDVLSINDDPDFSISLTIGPESIPFTIFATPDWHVMFLNSESPVLEEYITPLNYQIEEQSKTDPMTITKLLNMFSLAFNEKNQPQISAPRIDHTLRPARPTLVGGHDFTPTPPEPERPVEVPKPEDWENLIFPAIRQGLAREEFQTYEIDEWIRRIQVALQRKDLPKALSIIQTDIYGGSAPPDVIQKFFPRNRFGYRPFNSIDLDQHGEKKYSDVGGTQEASERLRAEIIQLKDMNTKELMGFVAEPSGADLYHWHVKLSGFGEDTPIGRDLTEWTLRHTNIMDGIAELPREILLEMKFPPNYPHEPPLFRIVKPRFKNIEVEVRLNTSGTFDKSGATTTVSSGMIEESSQTEGGEAEPGRERRSLSVSRVLERDKAGWTPTLSILEIIQQIRTFFLESGAKIDVENTLEGYSLPTVGKFWRSFSCVTPDTFGKKEIENGGKIILPMSALEELSHSELEGGYNIHSSINSGFMTNTGGFQGYSEQSPLMIFELSTGKGKRSFCGVEEFTAEENQAVVPKWIMENLQAKEGDTIQVRRVSLPKGNYVKLQPHNADFLEVNDTKAMLEWVLPKFVVMAVGDTIVIPYRNKKYSFHILEVRPGRAVHLIDSDVTTEFAPPLSGDPYSKGLNIPMMSNQQKTDEISSSTPPSSTATPHNTPASASPSMAASPGISTGRFESGVEGVDFKLCDNCKQKVPVNVYTMHTLSCARINWYCEGCKTVVQKSNKEEHMKEFHSIVYCECGESMESRRLLHHKEKECNRRIVRCDYCPLEMPYLEKFEHERQCGSQTEKCEKCGRYVAKKDLAVHSVDCTGSSFGTSPSRPSYFGGYQPTISSPVTTSAATSQNKRQGEDVMMCPICMEPFVHLDDLQVHLLSQHEGSYDDTTTATSTSEEKMSE
eukprot:TRINITY_DN3787_c0_g1_i6.p1 TRINITY_DN3787_c0_g1~~TRINITY_DN3787_c0_g1_i6.p1  ORF type:complete len:1009 (+),score=225.69 TRINITY_DN3787_c0_g1_i6:144-3170(+)